MPATSRRPTPRRPKRGLSRGLADLNAAEVNLAISQATYAQVIGNPPARLSPAEPVDRYLPRSREEATALAFKSHPAVLAAGFDVDVATTSINVAESSLLPTITLQGNVSKSRDSDPTLGTFATDQASVIGQVTAPIYDGGTAASQTRQAKEVAAQSRLVLDQVRNQARTAATGAWVAHEGAKIAVSASESEVRAAGVALQGVQKEAAGRPAHHGRRAELAAGPDFRQGAADRRAARPRDRLLHPAQRDRKTRRQDARAQHAGLSARGALPSGARRLARPAHAVGAVDYVGDDPPAAFTSRELPVRASPRWAGLWPMCSPFRITTPTIISGSRPARRISIIARRPIACG